MSRTTMAQQNPKTIPNPIRVKIALATAWDRTAIYKMRHDIYARELTQHSQNRQKKLTDPLDEFNTYLVAIIKGKIVGFISITPPNHNLFSVDKYLSRDEIPVKIDGTVFETRLLTVDKNFRDKKIASILMYAAIRWVKAHGGKRIIVLGRQELLNMYQSLGLQPLGHQIKAGAVIYELMTGPINRIQKCVSKILPVLDKSNLQIDWQLDIPLQESSSCFHGGASFNAIGNDFKTLEKSKEIISADVLDAWFPPSPKVLRALQDYLPWIARTSPPTEAAGMIDVIAQTRGVPPESILPGGGSSNLIFSTFLHCLTSKSRVLVLDPAYGEYLHITEQVIGCQVDRFLLSPEDNFSVNLDLLKRKIQNDFDLVILINPNNPSGLHIPREQLQELLQTVPKETMVWLDEAYIEYVGSGHSLEQFAAKNPNIIVCKSMSKVYALSGLRAGYLCASPQLISELRKHSPPWQVSLPAQIAAVKALQDSKYYEARYQQNRELKSELIQKIKSIDKRLRIIPGTANFFLCFLPEPGPATVTVIEKCKQHGLFLRDVSSMGSGLSPHLLRFAVKDGATNERMVKIFREVLRGDNPKPAFRARTQHRTTVSV